MLSFFLTYSIFPFLLFFAGAFIIVGPPVALSLEDYRKNRGRQSVKCPDNGEAVNVEVDNEFAFWTALRGQEHTRLKACSRWPEKGDCGQECQAQIDPSPENIERLLSKWYQGKTCAICTRALTPADWQRSRLALLNEEHKLFELRHMQLEQLQAKLEQMSPLCWNCHQEERVRQALPPRLLKGDRHPLQPAPVE